MGLQLQGLLKDWGYEVALIARTDSSSAIGAASRQGLGKLRHVQTRYSWAQERLSRNEFTLEEVPTKLGPANLGAKPLPRPDTERLMELMGQRYRAAVLPGFGRR